MESAHPEMRGFCPPNTRREAYQDPPRPSPAITTIFAMILRGCWNRVAAAPTGISHAEGWVETMLAMATTGS
jgi:hypothetical protein